MPFVLYTQLIPIPCNIRHRAYNQGMKKDNDNTCLSFVFGLFLLASATLLVGPTSAAEVGIVSDPALKISGELRVDQPVKAVFDLKGYTIPNGAYASINVRFLQKPGDAEPKVKTGYLETLLVFQNAGRYRITFILNEVRKPSCGGVEAKALLEETIELGISE